MEDGWKHIKPPKNYCHKNRILHLIFLGTCGHCILDFFVHFKYIALIITKIYELEQMKYICVKINMSQSMKICKYTPKLKLRVEFWWMILIYVN
jgi:hypothetical protein